MIRKLQRCYYNPNSVYGYRPKPGSSLDQFDIDWSNADEVAKSSGCTA